jgi:hypothetical protein
VHGVYDYAGSPSNSLCRCCSCGLPPRSRRRHPDCRFSKLDTQPIYPPVYASLGVLRRPAQNSGPSGSLLLSRKALSSSIPCRLSGKAMARTGLRMMPTFPSPPLKFRTAGFPRYGFKAGLSDEAFPADWFAIALRTLCCHRYSLLCVRDDALLSTSVRADPPLYPRGPRSGPGYVVPVHPHLVGPIRPTRGHIQTSPTRGLYQMPSLCIFAYA